jgi:D-alanyl-D-alanine carboxypeptidase/D-alanyl-D-alanine-endopeptidase (penicillin-binding protein 4)
LYHDLCLLQYAKENGQRSETGYFANPDFAPAHVGISLYDPSTQQYLYNYQADKFFVPASNTKLFACYAAMKNLGDSLVGLRYIDKGNGTIEAEGNGDASFLMSDFKNHPVYDFLKNKKEYYLPMPTGETMDWAQDGHGMIITVITWQKEVLCRSMAIL